MRSWTAVLVALVFVLAACTSGDAEADAPASGEVAISLELAGEATEGAIVVDVTLTNGADAPLTLVRPTVIPNFVRFWVEASDGTRMPFYGPYVRLRPLDDSGFVTLDPGDTTTEQLDLGEGFQLVAGEYSVWAEYRNPAGGSHEGGRAVVFEPGEGPVSEPIDITVTP